MGILKTLLHIVGGKPNTMIFGKDGKVRHVHPKSKWSNWQSKYFNSGEYNWRNHKGSKNSGLKEDQKK